MYYTTLKSIKAHRPCEKGWKKLLWHLHKTRADDKPLSILEILESNGIQDAIWALRAVDDPACERDARIFAVRCVRQVQHLLSNEHSLKALDVAEKYACVEASNEELAVTQDAAWDAARDATWDAARDAAHAATRAAAQDAAWDAAHAAARAAAQDAAWAAAQDAAWAAARAAAQDAAWDAARAAARAAAQDAAWDAAWDAQEKDFREIFCS